MYLYMHILCTCIEGLNGLPSIHHQIVSRIYACDEVLCTL